MRKAIILVSFGTGDKAVRRDCLAPFIKEAREYFSPLAIYEAWTSDFLREKAKRAGERILSLAEVLQVCQEQGFEEVIVQPLHLFAGEEFQKKILPAIDEYKKSFHNIALGAPLLEIDPLKVGETIASLEPTKENEALILVGHGSGRKKIELYERLQGYFQQVNRSIYIGSLEGDYGNLTELLDKLHGDNIKRVLLRPMLFSGGFHVKRDIFGSEENSWLRALQQEGFEVRYNTSCLGEYKDIRNIYFQRINAMLSK